MVRLLDTFTVAFFGHRWVDNILLIEELLDKQIRPLLAQKEYVDFLVGRNGNFDQCVASAIHRAKRVCRNDNSALVLVLPYMTAEYANNQENYEDYYDEIEVCQAAAAAHPKSAIQIRNREMVDRADLVICFVEKDYGGAYQTMQYALKQEKQIINLADTIKEMQG